MSRRFVNGCDNIMMRFCNLVLLGFLVQLPAFSAPVRVLVWDEQQPAQKKAYENFIGNEIAGSLRQKQGFQVTTARLDDPEQGLSDSILEKTDVLIWWGHVRQAEIPVAKAKQIVSRIQAGKLGLISLHSAHWSAPFMEAMNARARQDALLTLDPADRPGAVFIETNLFDKVRTPPKYGDRVSPAAIMRKSPGADPVKVYLTLPNCCFPAFRGDGKPSLVKVLLRRHPIVKGVPEKFEISQTEMYDEPFHVPEPDEVVFEERWATGEWFRSGSVWNLGKGRIFYFRPGHETFPVFKNANVLRVIENAARWISKK